jgi:hypothetical protein
VDRAVCIDAIDRLEWLIDRFVAEIPWVAEIDAAFSSIVMSLGELSGRPSNIAARISAFPVLMLVRVMRRPP